LISKFLYDQNNYIPLKIGSWKINVNGNPGTLNITGVNPDGTIVGSLNEIFINGIWDEVSQKIIFAHIVFNDVQVFKGAEPQIFKGYLFKTPAGPQPGEDIVWTITGVIETIHVEFALLLGGNSRRHEFGWFAQITEVF
jgi:hypothetical protein